MPHPHDLRGSLRWRSSEKVHLVDKGSETMGAIVFPGVLLLSGLNMRPYIYMYIYTYMYIYICIYICIFIYINHEIIS